MPQDEPSHAEMLASLNRVLNRLEDAAENVNRGLAPIVMLTPHRDLIPMRAVLDLLERMETPRNDPELHELHDVWRKGGRR